MFVIRNKKDSVELMKKLGLNHFPLQVFDKNDLNGISQFIEQYPSEEYILRNTDKAKGKFFFVKNFAEAKSCLSEFDNYVTLGVSYNPYKNNLVLVGDIKIERTDGKVKVSLTARADKNATHRNIYEKPKYNFYCDIEDDLLWNIKGCDKILKYVVDHELLGSIVEFAVYNVKLGINNEDVVISEIRTNY